MNYLLKKRLPYSYLNVKALKTTFIDTHHTVFSLKCQWNTREIAKEGPRKIQSWRWESRAFAEPPRRRHLEFHFYNYRFLAV